MAKYIVMAKQYGATPMGSNNSNSGTSGKTVQGDLGSFPIDNNKKGLTTIAGIFTLINTYVKVTSKDDKGNQITTIYQCPLNDSGMQRDLLPKLFNNCTVQPDAEWPARVNVNSAPTEVLTALPKLQATDVQKITSMRQGLESLGDVYTTPTWLLTEAQVSLSALQYLEPMITTRSQVYRVQSIGYFDNGKGPAARVEAIIDTNGGRPRILAWRNLSELGKGFADPSVPQTQGPTQNPNLTGQ
jgi:hypothetical protein